MSDEPKRISAIHQVLSLTLSADGTTTLTLDADVEGERQVVHVPGGLITQEIQQLMQENAALREQLATKEQADIEMAEKLDMQETEANEQVEGE